MREKIIRATTFLSVLSVVIAFTSLMGFPFPFSRAVWIREIWGVTGLIHAFLFFLIQWRINRASFTAPFAGIGLTLNYGILTVYGFFYILFHRELHWQDTAFFVFTMFLTVAMVAMFIDVLSAVYGFFIRRNKGQKMQAEDSVAGIENQTDASALILSSVGYVIIFACLYGVHFLKEVEQYGALKIIGTLISPLSFGGIGQEIDYYIQGKQNRFFCIVKSLTHILVLAGIFWVIYRRMPIASVAL